MGGVSHGRWTCVVRVRVRAGAKRRKSRQHSQSAEGPREFYFFAFGREVARDGTDVNKDDSEWWLSNVAPLMIGGTSGLSHALLQGAYTARFAGRVSEKIGVGGKAPLFLVGGETQGPAS